jgi:hypothetical protein
VVAFKESAAFEESKVAGCFADDGDFVAVLEVCANTWEILDDVDAEVLKLSFGTDT